MRAGLQYSRLEGAGHHREVESTPLETGRFGSLSASFVSLGDPNIAHRSERTKPARGEARLGESRFGAIFERRDEAAGRIEASAHSWALHRAARFPADTSASREAGSTALEAAPFRHLIDRERFRRILEFAVCGAGAGLSFAHSRKNPRAA